jgi:hypothetical protein
MPRRDFLLPVVTLGVAVLFAFFLIRLLLLRYERGDVYPAYSTLRADPLGTRAFYEAVAATGHYQVSRGFLSLHRELESKPNGILFLGLDSSDLLSFSQDEIAELDSYVKAGGRVVITLAPEKPYAAEESDKEKKSTPASPQPSPSPDDQGADQKSPTTDPDSPDYQTRQERYEREELRRARSADNSTDKDETPPEYQRSLAALWGFGWELHTAEKADTKSDDPTVPGRRSPDDADSPPEVFAYLGYAPGLEWDVPWKSALYFVRIEPEWRTLYYAKLQPVLMRRHWGKGDILLASDSYFISNEALRNDRRPALLSTVAGWPGTLLFDESHLGTEEQEGIMGLAEKFRLEGFLVGILGVVLLFLWRNSLPLVPPQPADAHTPLGGAVSGKDSRSGLVNLLRRNIPAREILRVCLTEWKKSATPGRPHLSTRLSEMEAVLSVTEPREIVEAYHEIRKISAPGKMKEPHATKS